MGKKKNTNKKHKFKHVESSTEATVVTEGGDASSRTTATSSATRTALVGVPQRDFSYVGSDLRRIGVMAAALVALELVLYYVLVYSPAGAAIYSLVKV